MQQKHKRTLQTLVLSTLLEKIPVKQRWGFCSKNDLFDLKQAAISCLIKQKIYKRASSPPLLRYTKTTIFKNKRPIL